MQRAACTSPRHRVGEGRRGGGRQAVFFVRCGPGSSDRKKRGRSAPLPLRSPCCCLPASEWPQSRGPSPGVAHAAMPREQGGWMGRGRGRGSEAKERERQGAPRARERSAARLPRPLPPASHPPPRAFRRFVPHAHAQHTPPFSTPTKPTPQPVGRPHPRRHLALGRDARGRLPLRQSVPRHPRRRLRLRLRSSHHRVRRGRPRRRPARGGVWPQSGRD